jgi:hypothetical protein
MTRRADHCRRPHEEHASASEVKMLLASDGAQGSIAGSTAEFDPNRTFNRRKVELRPELRHALKRSHFRRVFRLISPSEPMPQSPCLSHQAE